MMDFLIRPRRSKTKRTPESPPGRRLPDNDNDVVVVSPRRASSLLRGTVKSLASGSLRFDNDDESSLPEVLTVSLSKSSREFDCTADDDNHVVFFQESRNEENCHNHGVEEFMDSLQEFHPSPASQSTPPAVPPPQLHDYDEDSLPDPYLDYSSWRWSGKKKKNATRRTTSVGDCLDDYMTAYTSNEDLAGSWNFDHSRPIIMNKARVTVLSMDGSTTSAHKSMERTRRGRQEQAYWSSVVTSRTMTLGTLHRQTAEAFLSLGHAQMRLAEYTQAMEAFQSSCKIFKALDGPTHLSVGRALDAFGLAALRHKQGGTVSLIQAKTALEEAFAIRFHSLGVWHVDTVETFNKIASVYLHLGKLPEAAHAYKEVYLVRRAIYGTDHPSVAISAHGLANVYLKLNQPQESLMYFQTALGVYQRMHLPYNHPTVARLLRDRKRLEDYLLDDESVIQ